MTHNRRLVHALLVGAASVAVLVHVYLRPRPPELPRDMAALVERLRPLGLHVVTANNNGDPAQGVYFCTAPRSHDDLSLPRDVGRLGQWAGVVLITVELAMPDEQGERVGPFLLFGDPDLLRRVRAALARPDAPAP